MTPVATPVPEDAFPPTRWSAIVAARSSDPAERALALEALLSAYWKPVYSYIRLHWRRSPEDAQDLTQEFFARLLEKDFLGAFDPARARLRTFLRVAVDRLIANLERDAKRMKRGGGVDTLSLDFALAEGELAALAAQSAASPEELFEREWARAFFALAVDAFREECRKQGKELHFRLFSRHDLEDGPPGEAARPSYADLGREHGIALTAVTNHLAWARREFRRLALERLHQLTASEEEYQREARALLGIEAR